MLIGLISSGRAQAPHAAPARELYGSSAVFRGALQMLDGRADVTYVLSARHGLVLLDQVLEPGEQTLKGATTAERYAWAYWVMDSLKTRHGPSFHGITFEFHAGLDYRSGLEPLLRSAGAQCTCPVAGLSMGERRSFYAAGGSSPPPVREVPPRTRPLPEETATSQARRRAPAPAPAQTPSFHRILVGLRGNSLELATGASFKVVETGSDRFVVLPESTGKPRPIPMRELTGAYELLMHDREVTLDSIRDHASRSNPAYVFAILARVPGVTLHPGRRSRLTCD